MSLTVTHEAASARARVLVARDAVLDAIAALDERTAPRPIKLAACFARWEILGAVPTRRFLPRDCREARERVLCKVGRLRRLDGVTSSQRAAILRAERELRHALQAAEVAA